MASMKEKILGSMMSNIEQVYYKGYEMGFKHGKKTNPNAEVIVRCQNCKNWDGSWQNRTESGFGYCGELDMLTDKFWWCADGSEC